MQSFLGEEHHRCGGDGLRHGPDLEQGGRADRRGVPDAGHAVRRDDRLVAEEHAGGGAGHMVLVGRGGEDVGQAIGGDRHARTVPVGQGPGR